MTTPAPTSIELTKPRVIPITDRGHTYTLTVSPISKKQWLDYFAGIVSTSENVNGKTIESFDATGAKLALMNKILIDATGYRVKGDGNLTSQPNWQELIPANHRIAACNTLVTVTHTVQPDEEPILLGAETVSIDPLWGSMGHAGVFKVIGLKHTFDTPTVEQQRRYSRDRSRSQVVGGSRNGKTRWLGAQATLAEIYDELIQSVEGYTVDGAPLIEKAAIIGFMDTYHKVFAVESLFAPAEALVDSKSSGTEDDE